MRNGTCLVVTVFLSITLHAHDMYLMPERFALERGAELTVALHNGDTFPESEVSPALERVRDLRLVSATGSAEVKNIRVDGKVIKGEVAVPARGGSILVVRTEPYLLTLSPEEFLQYADEEGLGKIVEWRKQHGESSKPSRERYSKYAKSLVTAGGANDFHSHAVGHTIEIVPETSPFGLKPGNELIVRALFRGKPAAGLQIEATSANAGGIAHKTIAGRTDKDGKLRIPLSVAGKWRLHTIRMERCADPGTADWESYWASLTFEVR